MELLNGEFDNEVDYFKQVVDLLSKYDWIYKSPNTHILVDDIPSQIPSDWILHLSLDKLRDVEEAIKGEIQVILMLEYFMLKMIFKHFKCLITFSRCGLWKFKTMCASVGVCL